MKRLSACLLLSALAAPAAPAPPKAPPWRLGKPVSHQNLTIYPVLSAQTADASRFLTLEEGLATGQVRITELAAGAGAQVNRLAVINRSGRPLMLLAGEVIIGGNQDRTISQDIVVPPGEMPAILDVFCVEPGRWQGRRSHFGALQAMVNPAVRQQAVAFKSQEGVWARGREVVQSLVADTARANRRAAPASSSYAEVYSAPLLKTAVESSSGALKAQYEQALRRQVKGAQVVGAVVAINDRPVWADVFADARLFEKYWPKLLSSYVVEAMARRGQPAAAGAITPEDFLRRADPEQTVEKQGAGYVVTRSQAASHETFQLFSGTPGAAAPLHFTRFERR